MVCIPAPFPLTMQIAKCHWEHTNLKSKDTVLIKPTYQAAGVSPALCILHNLFLQTNICYYNQCWVYFCYVSLRRLIKSHLESLIKISTVSPCNQPGTVSTLILYNDRSSTAGSSLVESGHCKVTFDRGIVADVMAACLLFAGRSGTLITEFSGDDFISHSGTTAPPTGPVPSLQLLAVNLHYKSFWYHCPSHWHSPLFTTSCSQSAL